MTEQFLEYIIVYDNIKYSHAVDFKVYEIVGWEPDSNRNLYEEKSANSSMDLTYELDKAQTIINGSVKWDGCSHFYFGNSNGYIHLCGKDNIYPLAKLITHVFEICGSLMNSVIDDEFIVYPKVKQNG